MNQSPSDPRLQQEQIDVIQLMVRGWTDERIAKELGISPSTVKRRIYRASRVLSVASRAGLAARATSLRLIDDPQAEASGSADAKDVSQS